MIEMDCPHCNHPLRIGDRFAGQNGACKHCNGEIAVPASDGAIQSAPSIDATTFAPLDTIDGWRKSWQTYVSAPQRRKIEQKIDANIAEGKSADALWEKLDEIRQINVEKALTLKRYKAGLISRGIKDDDLVSKVEEKHAALLCEHKKNVANIEQQLAVNATDLAKARRDGKAYKVWITIGEDLHSDQDVANEAQGWIPVDDAFASGNLTPPSRPGCRCTVTYRKNAPDETGLARVEERVRATAKAREAMGL